MKIIVTQEIPDYPQLQRHWQRRVLAYSTDAGFGTYFVMLDERCRRGRSARVVAVPSGCCDILDGRLPSSWSLDVLWVPTEQRSTLRLGPSAWVENWQQWMERLMVGDEPTLVAAWEVAGFSPALDD
ncbi:MAG: hypothetical protein R2754_18850 [Microthrixaceae bacterium]